jgi:hypothetical protein
MTNVFADYQSEAERVRRVRRTAFIKRFTEYQHQRRHWINVAEIVDWYADYDHHTHGVPLEEASTRSYGWFVADLLAGDLEKGGRSQVLYLHADTPMRRMTRERLRDVLDLGLAPAGLRGEYLNCCWLPRRMFEAWLTRHNLPPSPGRFQPLVAKPEEDATAIVVRLLKSNQHLTVPQARAELKRLGFNISRIKFYRDIWEQARVGADLNPSKAGRKPGSRNKPTARA